jgi:hypothetical protein
MTEPVVVTYLVYLALSVALTVWVARTLHKNGRLFLVDVFRGNDALADSVNHLLVVGFYLINLGYISFALATRAQILTARSSIELLSTKVGAVLVVLGVMHFINLFLFSSIRGRALRRDRAVPPPPPSPVSPSWLAGGAPSAAQGAGL